MTNHINEMAQAYMQVRQNQQMLNEGALADRLRAMNKDTKKRWDKQGEKAKKDAFDALDKVKAIQARTDAKMNAEEVEFAINWFIEEDYVDSIEEAIEWIVILEDEGYDIIDSLMTLDEETFDVSGAYYASPSRVTASGKIQVPLTERELLAPLSNAAKRVFGGEDLQEVTTKETKDGTKYKVRVKDKSTNSSYIRFASREKIAELRANPNIASVELTDDTPANANAGGVTGVRQQFNAGPNANRSATVSPEQRRFEKERAMNKKAFGGV